MARVNVDDSFWVDIGRIDRGSIPYDQLVGNALRLLRFAQEQYKNGKCISPEQWEMEGFLECLLPRFAERKEDGYHVRGAAERFEWLKKRAEAGRSGGQISGGVRNSDSEGLAEAKRSKGKQTEASYSYSSSEEEIQKSVPQAFGWLVEIWNRHRGPLAELRAINVGSERHRAVVARSALLKTEAQWQDFIQRVASSDFLSGRSGVWAREDGSPVCDFDWCLKKKNAEKILAGNFTNKAKQAKSEWEDHARKVIMGIKKFGDGDPGLKDFLGAELWGFAVRAEGGFYSIRRFPDQPWVVNKLAGLLRESAAKNQQEEK